MKALQPELQCQETAVDSKNQSIYFSGIQPLIVHLSLLIISLFGAN